MARHSSSSVDVSGVHIAIILWVATILMVLGIGLGVALVI